MDNKVEQLIVEVLDLTPDIYDHLVMRAITFSRRYYRRLKRYSGDPLIVHPLSSAINAANLGLDVNSVITAILHHTHSHLGEKETQSLLKDIEQEFGEDVVELFKQYVLLNEATKGREVQSKILAKYLIGHMGDIRPLLIKLADIQDNVKTLKFLPEEKRVGKTNKIFNLWSPIAEYLDLGQLKKEIETRAFESSKPEDHTATLAFLKAKGITSKLLSKYESELTQQSRELLEYNPKIFGRIKSPYSMYKKTKKYAKEGLGTSIGVLTDLIALTIICKTKEDCQLMSMYLIESFDMEDIDDYIIKPKPNGFSGIHIILRLPHISKLTIEVQIQTEEMYYVNTYGPASHIAYKASKQRFASTASGYEWVEELHTSINAHRNESKEERNIPIDIAFFKKEIFTFTPKGQIIELPKGAILLDFAYRIHTEIGDSAVSGTINGKPAKLSSELSSGDMVEVRTDRSKTTQNAQWLDKVKTNTARGAIAKGKLQKIVGK